MKKYLLIPMLLLVVFSVFASEYIIGTGTSTQYYVPFYGLYDYSWSKTIYTKAEINEAGLTSAGNIDAISYYVGNTPSNYLMEDQRVYIRHTTLAAYETATDETGTGYPDNTSFTLVFQGDLVFNGGGWFDIVLTTPFPWNNTDNIEILWENWDGDYVSGYPNFCYTTATNTCVYKYQDNSFPTTFGTRSSSRPNIKLGQIDSAPNPAVLIWPPDDGWAFNNDTLIWTSGGNYPSSYNVYFGQTDPPAFIQNQPGTDYTPTLVPNTTYYWRIDTVNTVGTTQGTVWSFKTPTATQLAESFEITPFPPVGWANPGSWSRNTSRARHGFACAYKSGSATTQYILSTPKVSISSNSTLEFWSNCSSTSGILQVVSSPDRESWTQIGSDITFAAINTWYHNTIDLSSLAGNDYYLGFRTASSGSYYVDAIFGPEFTAEAPGAPTLSSPADAATNVNEFTTFTWTAPTTGGVPTGYKLYYDTIDPPIAHIVDIPNVATLTYTLTTPLNYNTTYYWTVSAYNNTGEGPTAPARSFTTREDPTIYTLPWLEDFGTTGTTFPPPNWFRGTGLLADPTIITSSTTYWVQDNWLNDTTVSPVNYAARMNIYGTNRSGWLITPPVQIPGTGYQLELDIGLTDYGNYAPADAPTDDRFIILVGDGSSWSTANIVREWNNTDSPYVYDNIPYTGQHVIISLDGYTGIKYIAFYGESITSGGDNDFFVDNVMVRETPAAPIFSYSPTSIDFGLLSQNVPSTPVNVTVTNLGGGTIHLEISNISITGPNAEMFTFDDENLPANLNAGEQVNIPVTATVTQGGAVSATLIITYEGTPYEVALYAEGLPEGIVIIGDGTANLYLPIRPYYGYSYSQSIFLQSELNTANQRIEKIWYYWNGLAAASASNNWTIYMGHTVKTAFDSASDWIPLTNLTQVFSGEVPLPAVAGWIGITLDIPFAYNNTDNLVIAVDENEDDCDSSAEFFYCTETPTINRSIIYYSDGTNPDPANPPIDTYSNYIKAGYPNIMLQFEDIPTVPVLYCTPSSLDFGEVALGIQVGPQNVTVTNRGGGTLTLTEDSVTIIGTNAGMFTFNSSILPVSLGANQSVIIPVYVTANTVGAISATLRITYSEQQCDVSLSATVLPENIIVIGTGTAELGLPIDPYYKYSYSQSIFLQSEINKTNRNIDKIYYYWNGGGAAANSNVWTVYLGHTDINEFANANAWIPITDFSVYNVTLDLSAVEGWVEINLEPPFYHTDQNLVIAVDENISGWDLGAKYFYCTPVETKGNRSISYADDSTNPDPTAPPAGTLVTGYPNIKLEFEEAQPPLPVELTSFTALFVIPESPNDKPYVQLNWISQSETNLSGYRVYRNEENSLENAILITPTMIPATNTSEENSYSIEDSEVENNATYYYWLESVDFNNSQFYGPVTVTIEGNVLPVLPEITTLNNAYPNPFRAKNSTKIEVGIKAGETGTFTIYNIRGEVVKSIKLTQGYHTINWDGKDSKGKTCGSGIYFYRLNTPSLNKTKKMVIIK